MTEISSIARLSSSSPHGFRMDLSADQGADVACHTPVRKPAQNVE